MLVTTILVPPNFKTALTMQNIACNLRFKQEHQINTSVLSWGYTSVFNRVSGGSEGDCLYRLYGSRGSVPGYPTCKIADVIQNFFMTRTLSLRSVGFDGQFARVAHKEFFTDGIGKLKVTFLIFQ